MNEPIMDTQAQAQSYLNKAETYKKLGLKAQVQFELEQARKVNPYIVQEIRYKTLLEDIAAESKKVEALKTPLRIGAGMLVVNALLDAIFLAIINTTGGGTSLESSDIISPIVDIVMAINLWQVKEQWKRYTVWWAAIGLVLFGLTLLGSGNYLGIILQIGFSGALILLLAGNPSKVRTIGAIAIFGVLYLGGLCLIFTLTFLGAL